MLVVLISGLHFRVMEKSDAAILKILIFRPFLKKIYFFVSFLGHGRLNMAIFEKIPPFS